MNIGDVLIARNLSFDYLENLKIFSIETRIFIDDFFIFDKRYFVKKITSDRVYISHYENVHINGIFDLDIKSEFYWFKFFTTQSNIRDEKLKELGI